MSEKKLMKKITGYPSIDKPWLKYYSKYFDESTLPEKSIYQLARDATRHNMHNIAIDIRRSVTGFVQEKTITYKDYFNEIHNNAKSSYILGIEVDEIIPILLPNILEKGYKNQSKNGS